MQHGGRSAEKYGIRLYTEQSVKPSCMHEGMGYEGLHTRKPALALGVHAGADRTSENPRLWPCNGDIRVAMIPRVAIAEGSPVSGCASEGCAAPAYCSSCTTAATVSGAASCCRSASRLGPCATLFVSLRAAANRPSRTAQSSSAGGSTGGDPQRDSQRVKTKSLGESHVPGTGLAAKVVWSPAHRPGSCSSACQTPAAAGVPVASAWARPASRSGRWQMSACTPASAPAGGHASRHSSAAARCRPGALPPGASSSVSACRGVSAQKAPPSEGGARAHRRARHRSAFMPCSLAAQGTVAERERCCHTASRESLPCQARSAAAAPAAQAGRARCQASARLQHDWPIRGQARERGQAAARGGDDCGRARAVGQAPREAGRAAGAGGRQVRQLAGRRGRCQRVHQARRSVAHALGIACRGQPSQPRSCARGSTPSAAAAGACCGPWRRGAPSVTGMPPPSAALATARMAGAFAHSHARKHPPTGRAVMAWSGRLPAAWWAWQAPTRH